MEHNTFIKRLEEVAEIKRVKLPKSAAYREADTACDIFRNGQMMIIDKDNNETCAYEIKRLKPIVKPCEDCGQECKDRRVNKSLYSFPIKHWRSHCSGCNRVKNPVTGVFDILPIQAQNHFVTFLKKQG